MESFARLILIYLNSYFSLVNATCMKRWNLILVIFLLFSGSSFANDFEFTPNLQNAYSELCKLKVQSAKQLLAKEPANNGIRIWLEDFADMIVLFASEDEKEYERLSDNEDKRLDLIKDLDEDSPYNKFVQAEIKLHWALVKMKLGHETKGGFNAISAYKLLEENRKRFPNFTANYKNLGVFHVMIGSVPENYKWVTKLLGLKGGIQQGLKELNIAVNDKIVGKEAKFYQLFIQSNVLTLDDNERQDLSQFVTNNPDNLAISFLGVSILLRNNKSEMAQKVLQNRPSGAAYISMPIFDLYQAEILFNKGNYSPAIQYYQSYLKNFRGNSFLKDVNFKLFLANWLTNNPDKALNHLAKIPNVGKKFSETDIIAQNFYEQFQKTKAFPNKNLVKACYAFEGGHYTEALAFLDDLEEDSFTSQIDKANFNFRKASILQKMNAQTQAIPFFERAMALCAGQNCHFGASSSLQLGYIYQQRNDKPKARLSFERAIAYKKHEYKNSIDNKAQAALTEMGI